MADKKTCGFVYMFLNYSNEIIYVGSTGDIGRRINEHHNSAKMQCALERTKQIRYCEVPTRNDALIAETILIQKYRPSFNKSTVLDGEVSLGSFDECSVEWCVCSPDVFYRKSRIALDQSRETQAHADRGRVFKALRELFPNANLRVDSVTKHQRHCLFVAMMQDGDYWLPRMTDFEVQLTNDELFKEFTRAGLCADWTNEIYGKDFYRYE